MLIRKFQIHSHTVALDTVNVISSHKIIIADVVQNLAIDGVQLRTGSTCHGKIGYSMYKRYYNWVNCLIDM